MTVTTLMKISGPSDQIERLAGLLCGNLFPGEEVLALAGQADPDIPLPFTLDGLVPEPRSISRTLDGPIVDMGLAALSLGRVDYLAIKAAQDPFLSRMPKGYAPEPLALLGKIDLGDLRGKELEEALERHLPGALAAGRAAVHAWKETGHFGWYDWRQAHWGCHHVAPEALFRIDPDGALSVRFETSDEAPTLWLRALCAAFPDAQIGAAGYDVATDYSIHVVTDETEMGRHLLIEECHEEEGVIRAQKFVHDGRSDLEENLQLESDP